jgi:allophanate hydrolase subunit 2
LTGTPATPGEGRGQHGDQNQGKREHSREIPRLRGNFRDGEKPAPLPATADQPIHVILGPQQEYFTEEAVATLLDAEFRISTSADRMGMQLDGPRLGHRDSWDIVSDAIGTGSIQVPGSGQPILLLADHQTTGGYPKIATVISTDLPVVGRRRPGDTIRFVAVTVEEAEQLARDQEHRLAALVASIERVPGDGNIDLATLYAGNLISRSSPPAIERPQ